LLLPHPFFSSIFFSSIGAAGAGSLPPGAGAGVAEGSGAAGAAGAGGGGGGGSSFFLQPAKVTVKAKKAPIDQKQNLFPIFSPPFKSLPEKLSAGLILSHNFRCHARHFWKNTDSPANPFVMDYGWLSARTFSVAIRVFETNGMSVPREYSKGGSGYPSAFKLTANIFPATIQTLNGP
jgi:hypothetical protein